MNSNATLLRSSAPTILCVALVGAITACSAPRARVNKPLEVSLIQLIATPERFHQKRVWVLGYYPEGYEMSAIFLSPADPAHGVYANGVAIGEGVPTADPLRFEDVQKGFVSVEGTFLFDAHGTGHMNIFKGIITDLTLFVAAPTLREER